MSICDNVEKITRSFIWVSHTEKRKMHMVSWEALQQPKDTGGMGVRSMR